MGMEKWRIFSGEDSRLFFQNETYKVGDLLFDIHAKNG
jgi:hypothetical protein